MDTLKEKDKNEQTNADTIEAPQLTGVIEVTDDAVESSALDFPESEKKKFKNPFNFRRRRKLNKKDEAEIMELFDSHYDETDNRLSGSPEQEPEKAVAEKPVWLLPTIIVSVIAIIAFILFLGWDFTKHQLVLKLNGDSIVTAEVLSDFVDSGAVASYNSVDISDSIIVHGTVDTSKPGFYFLDYRVSKGKKSNVLTRVVIVRDTIPPVITLKGDEETTVSLYSLYTESGFSAVDNYDGDISTKVVTEDIESSNGHSITYTATDSSGNTTIKRRQIRIKDIVAPQLWITGQSTVYTEEGSDYTDNGTAAIDDADGIVTDKIAVSGEVDTATVGTYTLTYTVSDSSGNESSATRQVVVYEKGSQPPQKCYAQSDGESRIYLTFDDGPSDNITPRILDILKENDVKATFFIVSYSDENKEIVKRAIAEGHSIGIHGYTHNWDVYSSDEAYMNNITSLHDKLLADTGYDARIVRFLGGSSNTKSRGYSYGVMSRLVNKVEEAGYEYYDWNVSSGDANENGVSPEAILSNIQKDIKPGRNNIILMHDSSVKSTTADALSTIIAYGKDNGYAFLPITPDTKPVHHGINN